MIITAKSPLPKKYSSENSQLKNQSHKSGKNIKLAYITWHE